MPAETKYIYEDLTIHYSVYHINLDTMKLSNRENLGAIEYCEYLPEQLGKGSTVLLVVGSNDKAVVKIDTGYGRWAIVERLYPDDYRIEKGKLILKG